jgi:thiol-disulfide isomerase/thioredoxin
MPTSRPNAASIRLRVYGSAERRLIVRSLLGAFAALAFGSSARLEELDIPSFESGRYQFTVLRPQRDIPSIRLFRLDGTTTELSALRGRPILLNFWATWCAACRTELPHLDRLQKQNAGLHVLAVSEDQADRATVVRFVETLGILKLAIYRDPNGYVAFSDRDNRRNAPFALYGMPITYLISGSGHVVGYMPGAADWSSEAARSLLEYLRRT